MDVIRDVIFRDVIYGMGVFEIIFFLLLGGFAPFLLWLSGTDQLKERYGNRFRGYLYKVVLLRSLWLLWAYWFSFGGTSGSISAHHLAQL